MGRGLREPCLQSGHGEILCRRGLQGLGGSQQSPFDVSFKQVHASKNRTYLRSSEPSEFSSAGSLSDTSRELSPVSCAAPKFLLAHNTIHYSLSDGAIQ